jgi:hypothetical protein
MKHLHDQIEELKYQDFQRLTLENISKYLNYM